MEHEMERLAREKIASQQKLVALKKELHATWDHIDINNLLLEQNSGADVTIKNGETFCPILKVTNLAKRNFL